MVKSNSTTRKKTSIGNSDGVLRAFDAHNTVSNILINHKENYYYIDGKVHKGEYEVKKLSNFIIQPLYFTECKNGITKYI